MRAVVVGASSGLGRCVGIELAQRGARVALLARRLDRLEVAATEAGNDAIAIACDVDDEVSCRGAIAQAAASLGGIDALIYSTGIGPLGHVLDHSPSTWAQAFSTNVTGAAIATSAAIEHLKASSGVAVYFSTVSASLMPPWPGLSAYIVSKAALDKLVESLRVEHPSVGFTRLVVGDCAGGEGDGMTEFANAWDPQLAGEFGMTWVTKGYISGSMIAIDDLVNVVDHVARGGASYSQPTVVVTPRPTTA
jgi:NAD(P)-dependent dehydrogenase (short-subunit alcohol dehydrogenase family)